MHFWVLNFNLVTCNKVLYYPRLCKKSSDSCVTLLNVSISPANNYSSFAFENNKMPLKFNETNILAFHSSIISKGTLKLMPGFSTNLCFRDCSQLVADIFFKGSLMEKPKGCFPTFLDGIPSKPVGVD